MSALDSIKRFLFKPAEDTVNGRLKPEQVPAEHRLEPIKLTPNSAYATITLRSLKIRNVQILWHKLYGVVYSFVELPVYQTEKAQFNVVTVPQELKNIDSRDMYKIVTRNKLLLNKVPYRGGLIDVQMGLFAVESDNLLGKYLDLLGELSDAAGVNSVKQALPFVKPITKGIDLILGLEQEKKMLVGLSQGFEPIQGHYVATDVKMNDKENPISLDDLTLDSNYNLCKNGAPLQNCSYVVFTIEGDVNRDTWFDIPELGTAYANLRLCIQSGTPTSIKEAYDILAKAILSSPDLLNRNGRAIAKDIYEQDVKDWLGVEEKTPEIIVAPAAASLEIPDTTIRPKLRGRALAPAEITKPELVAKIGLPKDLSDEDRDAAKKIKIA